MHSSLIPYPDNGLGPPVPPPTGSYRIEVDYATSSSYAETASFTLGYILSSSYSNFAATASYLLGSIANAVSASWANYAGHAITADTASYALTASYLLGGIVSASYALTASFVQSASYSLSSSYVRFSDTASYVKLAETSSYALTASYALNATPSETSSYVSGSAAVVNEVIWKNGSLEAYSVSTIRDSVSYAQPVDQFPDTDGNSAKWIVSITDGSSFRTSEIIAIWNPSNNVTNFSEVTTNSIGTISVAMSVNISGDNVRLIANPASGSWTIKTIRFVL